MKSSRRTSEKSGSSLASASRFLRGDEPRGDVLSLLLQARYDSGDPMPDKKLRDEISLNPNIGVVRGGALLLKKGEELVGAIAVSGFTGGDEICAREALAKVPMR